MIRAVTPLLRDLRRRAGPDVALTWDPDFEEWRVGPLYPDGRPGLPRYATGDTRQAALTRALALLATAEGR